MLALTCPHHSYEFTALCPIDYPSAAFPGLTKIVNDPGALDQSVIVNNGRIRQKFGPGVKTRDLPNHSGNGGN